MQSEQLTQELIEQTRQLMNQAEKLKALDMNALNWEANAGSWSILECLEHLNLYGDFYLRLVSEKLKNSNTTPQPEFKPGLLGGYFAKMILPKPKLKKMKTAADMNPLHAKLDKAVVDRFINQQMRLIELLEQSRKRSLIDIKITTSISRLIRLKLGDTFRFVVHHNMRHFYQIEGIQAALKAANQSLLSKQELAKVFPT